MLRPLATLLRGLLLCTAVVLAFALAACLYGAGEGKQPLP